MTDSLVVCAVRCCEEQIVAVRLLSGVRSWFRRSDLCPKGRCAAMLAATVMMIGCGGRAVEEAETRRQPIDVVVGSSIRGNMARTVGVTGTLAADEDVVVSAKVAGRVVSVFADVGDGVDVGTVLAQIDPVDFELALEERRLSFIEMLTELGLDELPAEADAAIHRLPAVERAYRQAENARARLRRADVLLEQDPPLISEQDHQDLRTTWEVAEQDRRIAELSARTQLARARTLAAQVATAERVLADATVFAPEGGAPPAGLEGFDTERSWSVAERMVGPGAYVQAGTPLFRLVDQDPLKLRVAVPERRLTDVVAGRTVRVIAEGFAEAVTGRVSRIAPAIDPRTRTFEVEILIPNSDRRLRPGGFARAAIDAGVQDDLVLIPADAVIVFAGVEKVFVLEGDSVREQRIETGAREGDRIEVLRGLEPGLTLVRAPSDALVTGASVRVVERRDVSETAVAGTP